MIRFKLLPWEYGIRNLFRRPLRSALTFGGLTAVVLLMYCVVGFIRGLESSLAASGEPNVVLLYGLGMGENIEYSSIPARTADLVAASLGCVRKRYGQKYASGELYLGTQIEIPGQPKPSFGIVRGVTPAALLVRRRVEIVSGRWPKSGEILAGRLTAAKLGIDVSQIRAGQTIGLEGRQWKISGVFSAAGSIFESELWCPLSDLQRALKRQDLSLVALTLNSPRDFSAVNLFAKQRLDLELASPQLEMQYYERMQQHYRPVRNLGWLVVAVVASAGVFAGLNTMYGAVLGRVRELATLQTIGFVRRAIALSLIQEGTVLAVAASLGASALAMTLVNGADVRFTMSAFELRVDGVAVLIGCGIGFLLGVVGSLPPAIRALKMPVVDGLKAI